MNVKVYLDKSGKWRWRLRARNGRILADSGQGYVRKCDAVHGLRLVVIESVNIHVELPYSAPVLWSRVDTTSHTESVSIGTSVYWGEP